MPIPLVLILLVFWLYLAYRAFERGEIVWALILVAVGIGLTIYRFGRSRTPPPPNT